MSGIPKNYKRLGNGAYALFNHQIPFLGQHLQFAGRHQRGGIMEREYVDGVTVVQVLKVVKNRLPFNYKHQHKLMEELLQSLAEAPTQPEDDNNS